jgi:hypothetical protein
MHSMALDLGHPFRNCNDRACAVLGRGLMYEYFKLLLFELHTETISKKKCEGR